MSQELNTIEIETSLMDDSKLPMPINDKDSHKRVSKRFAEKASNGVSQTTKKTRHCTTKILPKPTQLPSLTDKDIVCAYEAFYLDTDVIIKEIAFYFCRDNESRLYHIKPPIDIKYVKNDVQADLEMQTIFGHHLPWNSGKLQYNELAALLYDMTTKYNVFVYAPSPPVNPFKDYSHVNLADCGMQNPVFLPQETIELQQNVCPIHGHLAGNCALKTVLKIAKHLNVFDKHE